MSGGILHTRGEVVDLTSDDSGPGAPQPSHNNQQHPSIRASNGDNGINNGGHRAYESHRANSFVNEISSVTSPDSQQQNGGWVAQPPPAKRLKLSLSAPLQQQRVVTSPSNFATPRLDALIESAVSRLNDPNVDREKIRQKLNTPNILIDNQLAAQIRQGGFTHAIAATIDQRAKHFAKQLACLSQFRRTTVFNFPGPAAIAIPTPPPSAPAPTPTPTPTPVFPAHYNPPVVPRAQPAQQPAASFHTGCSLPPPQRQQPQAAPPRSSPPPARAPPQPATPASHRVKKVTKVVPTSPQNFRSRARVRAWRTVDKPQDKTRIHPYFALERRPYYDAQTKDAILKGSTRLVRINPSMLKQPEVFHVDFTVDETRDVQRGVRQFLKRPYKDREPLKDLAKLLGKFSAHIPRLAVELENQIPGRDSSDLENFLRDLVKRASAVEPRILSVQRDPFDKHEQDVRASRIPSLLLAREISGNAGFGSMRRLENFTNEFKKCREDALELRAEYTNCAGDISTISWVSNHGYVCGTTAHSDSHNQQYNKPGNLVLGSVPRGTLRSYPEHRVVRPVVEKGDNSTDAMRESQDPWLYSSVVSSDYDPVYDRTYTSGFDKTVKVWAVQKSGESMSLRATWHHDGVVNFVQASRHVAAMVATASDVPSGAVRIYRVNVDDISNSTYESYSCSRITDMYNQPVVTDRWAYFPSTMRWGIVDQVKHLLLVGYSPRSQTGDDNDIPLDRLNTGEICLWDGLNKQRIRITSASTQNVFEVLWHPSQPCFVVASSPSGLTVEDNVRTQIRIFRPSESPDMGHAFSEVRALDCPALDINELTIMPNSFSFCYVTAGCTDGRTYVWDTARGDKPIHVLAHGEPTEELSNRDDREREDTGVKFTAWGTSMDRFYTGSSDGIVKVWNVRSRNRPLVRVLLEASAQVSYGAFSPDYSKLVIGDASGRVFLCSVEEDEEKPATFVKLSHTTTRRRPTPVLPHPEPAPPPGTRAVETGITRANAFLSSAQLIHSRDPTIGVVKGPKYAETGLFCREAHAEVDPSQELLAHTEKMQQENLKIYSNFSGRTKCLRTIKEESFESVQALHEKNLDLDLDVEKLSLETKHELEAEKAEVVVHDFGFEYGDDINVY